MSNAKPVKSIIRISIKLKKEDKQAVINCITSLPTGIKLENQAELKRSHRFTFSVTRYQLINKLFKTLRKSVDNQYSIMPPPNRRKL